MKKYGFGVWRRVGSIPQNISIHTDVLKHENFKIQIPSCTSYFGEGILSLHEIRW